MSRPDHRPGLVPAVLGLGSNLGDRQASLALGLRLLQEAGVRVRRVSPVYETAPVGGPPQPAFLNVVALVGVPDADALLRTALQVEAAAGRVRGERWGPRTLDVDVIDVAGEQRDHPVLTLPHPRAHERAFVLAPWADVDPAARLPGHGRVEDLLAAVGTGGVVRRDDLLLALPEPA